MSRVNVYGFFKKKDNQEGKSKMDKSKRNIKIWDNKWHKCNILISMKKEKSQVIYR